jgi:two-component system sensor histidine kinase FlrB
MGAVINLLENALQACDAGGRVEFSAASDGAQIRLRVCDDGRGVDPKVRGRLFEPFFTTRAAGTGLGLAIARGVVRAHGGSIELAPDVRPGTEFIVHLPVRPAAADAAQLSAHGSTV